MVAQVHGNGLSALEFEINRTPIGKYVARHTARLRNENPGFVQLVDILRTHTKSELSPEVAEAFEQFAFYIYRAIELSELLPDPQVALEERCADEMRAAIVRISKHR